MKVIAFVDPNYYKVSIGGAEIQMFLMAKTLASRGWKVLYISDQIKKESIAHGVSLVGIPKVGWASKYRYLSDICKKEGVLFIYQRGRQSYTWLTYLVSRKIGARYIFSVANIIDCNFFKFFLRDLSSAKHCVKEIIFSIHNITKDCLSFYSLCKADLVLTQTNDQRKKLQGRWRIHSELLRSVSEYNAETNTKIDDGKIRVIWLASVKKRKNPEAFLRLVVDFSDWKDVEFTMAGTIRDRYYHKLIQSVQEKYQNFRFVRCSDLSLSNDLIKKSNIFINTSIGEEGFPNTFIQSWLLGTVVISLSFDPDNLLNSGLGYCSGSYDKMCKDLKLVINSSQKRDYIVDRAYSFAISEFSIDRNVNKFEGFLACTD